MTTFFLAGLPLLFVAGFLTWTMVMGAREQSRSDAFAKAFVARQGDTHH